ncbi:enoyl-CoA hydratase/isomerase family protein [Legionella dresdenensis]|uniref:3-hydroxyisobutyryl-CoA hydrolase n=1 Tax=Legionella dresdenensis TaxID=450200 RepID=A0ABV8CBW7_9GAMM
MDIVFERRHHLGIITLARPQALNALTLAMIQAMQAQLLQWQDDSTVHAVIIQAEPGKAFCAGGDVRRIYDAGQAKDPQQLQFFWHEYRLNLCIHHYNKPYIALMDGITMGGGVGISLHGSHPVATQNFVFAMPETGIGLFPDIGASYHLVRCPGASGNYLGLTGNRLNNQDALALGLVRHCIDSESLAEVVTGLVALDLTSDAHKRVSEFLNQFSQPAQQAPILNAMDNINHYFSESNARTIAEKLAASKDEWAINISRTIQQKSPLSMAVTCEQLQRAKKLSLAECLIMDYRLVNHFMAGHDFYEGIRALLVDKDKSPRWQPKRLEDISETMIKCYFDAVPVELSF